MNLGDPGHKIVQVGPEHRCSQFEHHAWLFCWETKWKQLQTQVQNLASVRDSLKPWISPDRFQLVNFILRGAPVSGPIRDVYKWYRHLHIITYSSTSASNSAANVRARVLSGVGFGLWRCLLRMLVSVCLMFEKWNSKKRKQGYFRLKTLRSSELCLSNLWI